MRKDSMNLSQSSTEDVRETKGRTRSGRASLSPHSRRRVLFRSQEELPDQDLRREQAYQWYTRCGRPPRKNMKTRVCKIQGCEISPKDVDLLPWMANGLMVDTRKMMTIMRSSRV